MELLQRQTMTVFPDHDFFRENIRYFRLRPGRDQVARHAGGKTGHGGRAGVHHAGQYSRIAGNEGTGEYHPQNSGQILDYYKIKRNSHYITNMWANITHPNHRHHLHIHPNCLLSGILYVRSPKNCGPTVFGDPRPGAMMIQPSHSEINPHNMTAVVVVQKAGC